MKEMEAKELRVGNLVKYEYSVYLHGGKITEVGNIIQGETDYYQPIPLTEEWLFKFRFKEIIVDSWYSKLAKNKDTINISKSGLVAINDDKPIRAIEYVHQLQNLYFALTGTELKYNERK
jgi:hypothetical protein